MQKFKHQFNRWWHCFGSGITQSAIEDHEGHTKRVAEAAYNKGRYDEIIALKHKRGRLIFKSLIVIFAVLSMALPGKLVIELAKSYQERTIESISK